MAMQKKNVDWTALEVLYRTGRSFRLLAKEFGISSTRIKQVADENNLDAVLLHQRHDVAA